LCQGNARVDLAVVNGSLSGFEIKSERDTLQRLPHQVQIYSRALDSVTIVANGLHVKKIGQLIPEWWGIIEAFMKEGEVAFSVVRQDSRNPDLDPFAVAQLLWRPEVVAILNELGLDKGLSGKSRRVLWDCLAQVLPLNQLRERVRETLKAREHWRSGLPPSLDDGLFQSSAT
jgi:hypothetical protein